MGVFRSLASTRSGPRALYLSSPDKKREAIDTLEDWERVLSAAARLQNFIPKAILVGGTAAANYAEHRFSHDDDHVVRNLIERFESVLRSLESQAGWTTNRINPPVLILKNLDGVETGVRNLVRAEPLETETYDSRAGTIVLPTLHEMARIKSWLVVTRNATRDYVDLIALLDKIEQREGAEGIVRALEPLDRLYPQRNQCSVVLQVAKQLAEPRPHDLGNQDLTVYRLLSERWRSWQTVCDEAIHYGSLLLAALGK